MYTRSVGACGVPTVAVVLLAASLAVPAVAGEVPEQAWAAELAASAAGASPAESLATVLDLAPLTDWLAPEEAVAIWRSLADADLSPLAGAMAAYHGWRAAANAGLPEAAAFAESLGFVETFAIVGPLANDGMAAFDETLGPELDGVDVSARYEGRVGEIGWVSTTVASETGYLDLSDFVQPSFNAVAYVAFDVSVSRRLRGALQLAVDGAYRVWIDGRPAAQVEEHLGGYALRDAVPIDLAPGTHQIVVKLASADGPLGLHARLVDAAGRRAPADTSPAEAALGPLASSDAWPTPLDLADQLGLGAGPSGASPAEAAAMARVLRELTPRDPSEPWREWADAALRVEPGARTLLWVAEAESEHWRRVELLARAVEEGGDDRALAAWSVARLEEMGTSGLDEVRARWSGRDLPATVGLRLAEAARDLGLTHVWAAEVDALAREVDDAPAVLDAAMGVARTLSRGPRMHELARRAWETRQLEAGAAARWLGHLRTAGDLEAAEQVVSRIESRGSPSLAIAEVVAEHLRATGNSAWARARLELALAQCPGATDLLARLADLQMADGDDAAAAQTLGLLLARRPQDDAARSLLDALEPQRESQWTAWRVDVETLRSRAIELGTADGVDYTVLVDQRVVDVHPSGLATTWVQQAWHVHTLSGAESLASTGIGFSEGSEVVDVLGVEIVGADGTRRSSYEQFDRGPGSGPSSIYYDVSTRILRFPALAPGDLLVLEYTVADVAERNIFDDYFGDVFLVQDDVPVDLARFVVRAPEARTLRYAAIGNPMDGWNEEVADGVRTLIFEARSVGRVRPEPRMPGWSESYTWASVSTYADWDTLANWYWSLIDQQLVVTPEMRALVAELTAGADSTEEIVEVIHEYVVRNTRYVGLEFGVHGYKPYRTSEIFERRFGDCKDSASLMKVMLELAGVPAHIVLVRTRDMGRVPAFPPSLAVFNHAIAWVPELDRYLDGTAGFSGATELPSMDQGASALIVLDGEGGRFHEIPWSHASENVETWDIAVDLRAETPRLSGSITFVGLQAPGARQSWEQADQQRARLEGLLAQRAPGVEVTEVDLRGVETIREPVRAEFAAEGGQLTRPRPDGFGLPVSPGHSPLAASLAAGSTREHPLVTGAPTTTRERFTWELPDGCAASTPSGPGTAESAFGGARVSVATAEGTATVETELRIDVSQVDPSDYAAFRAWVGEVDALFTAELSVACEGGAR